MLTDYLWTVQHKAFPLMVNGGDVGCVRLLREAGLLTADILLAAPVPEDGLAFVTGITPAGHAELDRMRSARSHGPQALRLH